MAQKVDGTDNGSFAGNRHYPVFGRNRFDHNHGRVGSRRSVDANAQENASNGVGGDRFHDLA